MRIRPHPYIRHRKLGPTYYVNLYDTEPLRAKLVAKLSGFSSLEDAQEQGQYFADLINKGEVTPEELKEQLREQRSRTFQGLTQLQWAEKLNVHRNAIYQGARAHKITWEEWVVRKLEDSMSPSERRAYRARLLPKPDKM